MNTVLSPSLIALSSRMVIFLFCCLLIGCNTKQTDNNNHGKELSLTEPIVGTEQKEIVADKENTPEKKIDIHKLSKEDMRYLKLDISNTIGVVKLQPLKRDEVGDIRLLNEDDSEWLSFSYGIENFEENKEIVYNLSKDFFEPRMIHYDYDILVMDCVSEDEFYYEVIVHHFPRLTKRLVKAPHLQLEPWEEHVQTVILGLLPGSDARDEIDGEVSTDLEEYGMNDPLQAIQVEGNWMKVKDTYNDSDSPAVWIKWRNEKELQVGIWYLM